MTIKIVTLVSGETLIGNLGYLLNEREDIIAYQIEFPCKYELNERMFTVNDTKKEIKLSFIPWPELSYNEKIDLPLNSVVAIANPIDDLLTKYQQVVLKDKENG